MWPGPGSNFFVTHRTYFRRTLSNDAGPGPDAPIKRSPKLPILVSVTLSAALLAGCGQESSSGGHPRSNASKHPTSAAAKSASPTTAAPTRKRPPAKPTDITRLGIVHHHDNVAVRITLADVSTLWPEGDEFDVYVDTNGDHDNERSIFIPWGGAVTVYDHIDTEGHVYCRVPPPKLNTPKSRFTFLIPIHCLGTPAHLRASAELLSDHEPANSTRKFPYDDTAWTPFAAVGQVSSVKDPRGDPQR